MNRRLLTYLPFTLGWIRQERKKAKVPNDFYRAVFQEVRERVPEDKVLTSAQICRIIGLDPHEQQPFVVELDGRPVTATNEWAIGKIIRWEDGWATLKFNAEMECYQYTF